MNDEVLLSIERTAQILLGSPTVPHESPAGERSSGRHAAVALVLQERKNGPELLVIQRALNERDPWSGQLAFPGGKRDPADMKLLDTALRETREELGLDLAQDARLLGRLPSLQARGPRPLDLTVVPFVFELTRPVVLRPDPGEVHASFWLALHPLQQGADATSITVERQSMHMTLPGYTVGEHVLWGMSYQMLQSLFALEAPSKPPCDR